MEVCGQNGFKCDEEKALSSLLDAFGSAFSLEEIASAYCKANGDANLTGEILFGTQRSPSISTINSPNADAVVEACAESLDSFSSDNSFQERYRKPKVRPVSVGIVSSRLAKEYVRSMPSANRSYNGTTKPLKLDANLLTMSESWAEKCEPNISNHNQLHQDMEDFLFKMLGDGFQLDREKIQEVLDNCGYDMKKSMDKLMDGSILTFDKEARVVGESSTRSTYRKPKSEVPSYEKKSQNVDYLGNKTTNKGVDLHSQSNGIEKLQKELLTSLFQVREHSEESSKKIMKDVKKFTPYRKVVSEPPEDSLEEFEIDMNFSRQEDIDPEDEEKYQSLRKAVKEYRVAMIEYHRAAVDAFVNGEHEKAKKLLDEGQVYLTKAREADEESSKMIVDTKEESQELVVDLRDYSAGEVIRSIKCHLSTLSGIPSFEHLKVIIDSSDQNVTQSSRSQKRKKRITEMLEKLSINWIEGDTVGIILISLDKLDPKR